MPQGNVFPETSSNLRRHRQAKPKVRTERRHQLKGSWPWGRRDNNLRLPLAIEATTQLKSITSEMQRNVRLNFRWPRTLMDEVSRKYLRHDLEAVYFPALKRYR